MENKDEIRVSIAYDGTIAINSMENNDTISELNEFLKGVYKDFGKFSHMSKNIFGDNYLKVWRHKDKMAETVLRYCIVNGYKFSWSGNIGDDLMSEKFKRELDK